MLAMRTELSQLSISALGTQVKRRRKRVQALPPISKEVEKQPPSCFYNFKRMHRVKSSNLPPSLYEMPTANRASKIALGRELHLGWTEEMTKYSQQVRNELDHEWKSKSRVQKKVQKASPQHIISSSSAPEIEGVDYVVYCDRVIR